jgi:DNA polymerase I-like protein with 3'-5' exonuclease and polymerase domains
MKLTLDVENNSTERGGKLHLDPFEPENSLVQVGMLSDQGVCLTFPFDHKEHVSGHDYSERVQMLLDEATVLICHNAVHDLLWLWESGFKYDGPVFDTMLAEYVLQCGVKQPLSLEACAERHELDTKKQDTLKEYFKKGYKTSEIPLDELTEYLVADLEATQQLADTQYAKLNTPEYSDLMGTVDLSNQVAVCLARIYQRGFKVDLDVLDEVGQEFQQERTELQQSLQQQVHQLMGDTPINLNSPEQLSWVIYSRKPKDKSVWANSTHPYMKDVQYRDAVRTQTQVVYKTKAVKCEACNGTGYIRKTKKNGEPFSKPNKCITCAASGFIYEKLPKVAGLKFNAPSAKWASANGFSTSKDNLKTLSSIARQKGMEEARQFLDTVIRLSAVETYLSSFIEGIKTHTKVDNRLHVRLLQHRTATGRFSGADPNMQNMPRGKTFPVKKVFVSRWDGGQIMEADFAQLEFRVAAFLSQDPVAMEEVRNGFDVHSYTAKVITDAGQNTSRQDAKAHTFAPLYGATGFGRTPSEAAYYHHFNDKYQGIAKWHEKLATEALTTKSIETPSGRKFSFPDVQRQENGRVSYFTQIKNYPVQSFATADIVPLALLHIDSLLAYAKSCIVNTVHDSIVIDVHPHEERLVLQTIQKTNDDLPNLIAGKWGITFNVPLLLEAKIGPNWLDTKDVM